MLGFGHDSGVVRIGALDAFPVLVNGIFPVLVLAVDLAGFIAGSVCLRAFRRPAVALAAGEGMDGGELPLFAAIAIWAGIAIGAFLLAMWWLGRVPFWQLKLDPKKQAENIVKIALTLVGGVGAVAYLVIKYQERQQAGRAEKREKDRTVDTKVQAAINQLGSDKASTRIAGVYALTDIADTYRGGYRQRVVDILCGYLRSDRANYALNELGQPVKNASGHLVKSGDSDEAVESTILSVMHDRLRKKRKDKTGKTIVRQTVDDDQLWCDCEFDLHEATFHEVVDLTYSTFECVPNFRGTKFEHGDFHGTHFAGNADFGWADFAGVADFGGATFTRDANFDKVTFTLGAYFTGAEFRASAAFSVIRSQLSFNFEACKFNERFRDAYEWRPIPIPEDNDGLPAGAVWKDFQEEDDKDGGTTTR
ncbi:pentapeptide repeat-containing protein [Bifidobacterium sp.]|uniref:pentapeptide repeat-containing protein n=1 Tax=Bifidobacterium sp. TaxID=41200 RepID=UPI00284B8A2A|nr:pentapeptide repeat-containing protein [Bifidobacterium sp.]MDR4020157.1 pentapeptide repeat-containing protein [Bifidobacterium sp.]